MIDTAGQIGDPMTAPLQDGDGEMSIPFTQYMMPDGRKVLVSVERPIEVAQMAQQFIDAGGRFECEVLSTGQVSLTAVCEIDGEEQDAEIEVCANGPAVSDAVDRLVRRAIARTTQALTPASTEAEETT